MMMLRLFPIALVVTTLLLATARTAQADIVYSNYTPGQNPANFGPDQLTASTQQGFDLSQGYFQLSHTVETEFTIFGSEEVLLPFPDAELIIPLHIFSDSDGFSIQQIDISIQEASGSVFNNNAGGSLLREDMVFDQTQEYTIQMNGALQPGVNQLITIAAQASATTSATGPKDLFKVFNGNEPGPTNLKLATTTEDSFDDEVAFLLSDAPYVVPEPNTAAALCLAGLACLIRRRR